MKYSNFHITFATSGNINRGVCDFRKIILDLTVTEERVYEMSTNLSATMNGTQPSNCYNPTALRIGHTIAYCVIFIISVVGNSFIGIIVYKTKNHAKTHQLSKCEHGYVRPTVPDILDPENCSRDTE